MLIRNNGIQVQKKCLVIDCAWQEGQRLNIEGSKGGSKALSLLYLCFGISFFILFFQLIHLFICKQLLA